MASQLRKPQAGDITATMKTTMGEIQILLFPDAAPKAVENFTPLREQTKQKKTGNTACRTRTDLWRCAA